MIALPPYVLLIPFGIFLAGYVFFGMANIVSLAKYGARNGVGLIASFLFVAGSAVVAWFVWSRLAGVDWITAVPVLAVPSFSL